MGDGLREALMHSQLITLPAALKQFVDSQIAKGRYSDVTDYVCDLIRADEERIAEAMLEAAAHAPPDEETGPAPEDWRAIREEALAQAKKTRGHD